MVKSENFNLFEAMSAIELCDQKMDSGMVSIEEELNLSDAIRVKY